MIASVSEMFAEICRLAEELQANDPCWHTTKFPPVSKKELRDWEFVTGITLPKEIKAYLQIANGLSIGFDYSGSVMRLYGLDAIQRGAEHPQNNVRVYFGTCTSYELFFNRNTGNMIMKRSSRQYEGTETFQTEILLATLSKLQYKLQSVLEGKILLAQQLNNPYRKYYDALLALNTPERYIATFEPPASAETISAWEREQDVHLPEEYKAWLMLSNGSQFGYKHLLSLEQIETYRSSPVYRDGVEFLTLVLLTGCFDHLMCNSQTGEMCVLTEDFEWEELISFDYRVFEWEIESILESLEESEIESLYQEKNQ